jgi:biotin synthase
MPCMYTYNMYPGAAWRDVGESKDRKAFSSVLEMVRQVNAMGMEVCCTLGMLTYDQAKQLKEAGLTAYNHNLDTSREFYPQVIRIVLAVLIIINSIV